MAFVIAAPASNNGKTLTSLLLSCWLRRHEKSIQTFKAGPDYLDPQLLSAVSNKPCRNLDPILTGLDWVVNSFNSFDRRNAISWSRVIINDSNFFL